MTFPALSASDLRFGYGKGFSLWVPSLEVHQGHVTCLVGPSGAGKSTLLRLLAFLEKPTSGEIRIDGMAAQRRPQGLAMVLQGGPMWKGTVEDNLILAMKFAGVPPTERRSLIETALTLLELTDYRLSPVSALSGGQAQRVALARAVVAQPTILLLDEPMAHIDEPSREVLAMKVRRHFVTAHTALVWVTHDRSEALSIGNDLAVIDKGSVLQQGTPQELIERPSTEQVARFLGTDNIIRGTVITSASGIASVRTGDGSLCEVVTDLPIGTDVLVMVRSEDVTLGTQEPPEGSPRNRYKVELQDVLQLGATTKLLTKGHLDLSALVTRPTYQQLGLYSGQQLWVGFKASSAQVLRMPGNSA